MFERDGQFCLRVQSSVQYHRDVVVRGDGFEHQDGNGDVVFIFRVTSTKDEVSWKITISPPTPSPQHDTIGPAETYLNGASATGPQGISIEKG